MFFLIKSKRKIVFISPFVNYSSGVYKTKLVEAIIVTYVETVTDCNVAYHGIQTIFHMRLVSSISEMVFHLRLVSSISEMSFHMRLVSSISEMVFHIRLCLGRQIIHSLLRGKHAGLSLICLLLIVKL